MDTGIENKPTYDELIEALKTFYEAMYHENMYCPCCAGHIGYNDEHHEEYCIALRVPGLLRKSHD